MARRKSIGSAAAVAALAFAALTVAAVPARAVIVAGQVTGGTALAGGGAFVQLFPVAGFTVGQDNLQSNNLFAFDELQNVILTSLLKVNTPNTNLAIGTRVSSHVVLFDPVRRTNVRGFVDFDQPILGIIRFRNPLIASDYLGLAGVNYLSPTQRGVESSDLAVINAVNPKRLDVVLFEASAPGDMIRVITQGAVPEPAAWAMMIAGFGLVGAVGRARRLRSVTA